MLRLGVCLVCLLIGVYGIVYVNVPDSADGYALLAVAASLVRHGEAGIEPLAASDAQFPIDQARMGAYGSDGTLYSKKGLLPSLALIPWVAAAEAAPFLTTLATAMTFNALVTALTALLLFAFVGRLGYAPRTAFLVGVLYGLATLALVYVKTLYGEPLAGLLLLLAIFGGERVARTGEARHAALMGSALGMLVGVNTVYGLALAIFGVYVLWRAARGRNWRGLIAFALAAGAFLALYAVYNAARFGSLFETGYHFAAGEGFTTPPLTGLFGLTISPYRGLFWYNPVLLLALPGALLLRRRFPLLTISLLGLSALQIVIFALWWAWDGGIAWGPRFTVPILPLLCVFLAPVIEWAGRSRRIALVVILLGMVSTGVQLLGALIPYEPYIAYLTDTLWEGNILNSLRENFAPLLTDASLSPIVGHYALLTGGWPLAPVALQRGGDSVHLLIALGTIGAGILVALAHLPDRTRAALAGIITVGALVGIAARQGIRDDVREIAALGETLRPAGTVLAQTTVFGDRLLDIEGEARVITFNAPNTPDDPDAAPLYERAVERGGRLWMLTWFPPADALNWMERDLWLNGFFVEARAVSGHRALWFELPAAEPAFHAEGSRFGAITLVETAIQRAEDGVFVALRWRAEQPLEHDLAWFVHLLRPDGGIAAQQDRAPLGGYWPVSHWEVGALVTDRLFFPIADADETWALRIGWVHPDNGEAIPAFSVSGEVLPDPFIVLGL